MPEETQNAATGHESGGKRNLDVASRVAALVLFYGGILFAVAYNLHWFDLGQSDFTVVAAPIYEDSVWTVSGRVLTKSGGAGDLVVWAVASNDAGHGFASDPVLTDSNGFFRLTGIPPSFSTNVDTVVLVNRLTITATARPDGSGPDYSDYDPGETELSIGSATSSRIVTVPGLAPALLAVAFLASILAAYLPISFKANYLTSVTVAFFFVVLMVGYIAAGMGHVTRITSGLEQTEVLSLGIGYIYNGKYVDEPQVANEWIFSLTSKPDEGSSLSGFGAPLWVILLAVLGAGLYTLSTLVEGITSVPASAAELAPKLHAIVLHQLYVFFAPIGAIFVYQLVVAADAAREPLTVGFSVLAAGVGFTWILRRSKASALMLIGDEYVNESAAPTAPAAAGKAEDAADKANAAAKAAIVASAKAAEIEAAVAATESENE
ncbi:MAG: hypothetical protein ACC655_00115 [Rhodothermia bacterium]